MLERIWYENGLACRLAARALQPLELIYRTALAARPSPIPVAVGVPVISVGNLTVGGNGKTPLVIDLAERLQARALPVAVVARGYGRASRRPLCFSAADAPPVRETGDEAALIARRLPGTLLVLDVDRVRAAQTAVSRGAKVILADDAFQHHRLGRQLDLLAVHARRGFGNRRLLPAGPLREPMAAVQRAHLVIFTYASSETESELLRRHGLAGGPPATVCAMEPAGFVGGPDWRPREPPTGPVVVFCGLANGRGFVETCRRLGVEIDKSFLFPDHHFFSANDLRRLEKACHSRAATALCSEKDLVRLPPSLSFPVAALRLRVRWREPQLPERLLDRLITDRASTGSYSRPGW